MASSKDYLQFVLEQLSELQETLLWRLACIGRKRMKAEWISFFRLLPVPVAGP